MHWTSVMFSIYHPVVTQLEQLTGLNPMRALTQVYIIYNMQSEKLCILTADKSTLLTQRSELIN